MKSVSAWYSSKFGTQSKLTYTIVDNTGPIQQRNNFDCGCFLCVAAYYICAGEPFPLTMASQMSDFRHRLAYTTYRKYYLRGDT